MVAEQAGARSGPRRRGRQTQAARHNSLMTAADRNGLAAAVSSLNRMSL
jgi:hypothetical protein